LPTKFPFEPDTFSASVDSFTPQVQRLCYPLSHTAGSQINNFFTCDQPCRRNLLATAISQPCQRNLLATAINQPCQRNLPATAISQPCQRNLPATAISQPCQRNPLATVTSHISIAYRKQLTAQRTEGTIGSVWKESTPSKETTGPAQTDTQSETDVKTNSWKFANSALAKND